ncbi:unnamed protein product [Fraxinus pennsylvanica]|uniref:Uncharacterized protein n=1 Tax=Fraxinus pennsylvanica TaxID=56036 RepID=A0AAD1ZGW8_9LAMI|nr:unnamed protein product [Fraxinus pennsylvanica]
MNHNFFGNPCSEFHLCFIKQWDAPKQKWDPEEEAAPTAGVFKNGQGKWPTILKDPQFSHENIFFSLFRLDNLTVEAVNSLRESVGTNKTTIAAYIKDQHLATPELKGY